MVGYISWGQPLKWLLCCGIYMTAAPLLVNAVTMESMEEVDGDALRNGYKFHQPVPPDQNNPWISGPQDKKFQFHVGQQSWLSAREHCLSQNSDLVTIQSQDELDWVLSHYKPQGRHLRERQIQIGLMMEQNKKTDSMEWRWLNRRHLNHSVIQWTSGEPYDHAFGKEKCALLNVNERRIDDVDCDLGGGPMHFYRFICERTHDNHLKHEELNNPLWKKLEDILVFFGISTASKTVNATEELGPGEDEEDYWEKSKNAPKAPVTLTNSQTSTQSQNAEEEEEKSEEERAEDFFKDNDSTNNTTIPDKKPEESALNIDDKHSIEQELTKSEQHELNRFLGSANSTNDTHSEVTGVLVTSDGNSTTIEQVVLHGEANQTTPAKELLTSGVNSTDLHGVDLAVVAIEQVDLDRSRENATEVEENGGGLNKTAKALLDADLGEAASDLLDLDKGRENATESQGEGSEGGLNKTATALRDVDLAEAASDLLDLDKGRENATETGEENGGGLNKTALLDVDLVASDLLDLDKGRENTTEGEVNGGGSNKTVVHGSKTQDGNAIDGAGNISGKSVLLDGKLEKLGGSAEASKVLIEQKAPQLAIANDVGEVETASVETTRTTKADPLAKLADTLERTIASVSSDDTSKNHTEVQKQAEPSNDKTSDTTNPATSPIQTRIHSLERIITAVQKMIETHDAPSSSGAQNKTDVGIENGSFNGTKDHSAQRRRMFFNPNASLQKSNPTTSQPKPKESSEEEANETPTTPKPHLRRTHFMPSQAISMFSDLFSSLDNSLEDHRPKKVAPPRKNNNNNHYRGGEKEDIPPELRVLDKVANVYSNIFRYALNEDGWGGGPGVGGHDYHHPIMHHALNDYEP